MLCEQFCLKLYCETAKAFSTLVYSLSMPDHGSQNQTKPRMDRSHY